MTNDMQCMWHDVDLFHVQFNTNKDYSVIIFQMPGGFSRDESNIYLNPQQLDHLIHQAIQAKLAWVDRREG